MQVLKVLKVMKVMKVLAVLQYQKFTNFRVWLLLTYNVKARDPVGSKNMSEDITKERFKKI